MSNPVRDQIAALIDEVFGVPADALVDDVELQDGLQLDSLSVVELQLVIEDTFNIRLEAQEGADIVTFGQLVATVQQAVAGGVADNRDVPATDDEARSA